MFEEGKSKRSERLRKPLSDVTINVPRNSIIELKKRKNESMTKVEKKESKKPILKKVKEQVKQNLEYHCKTFPSHHILTYI